MVAYARHLRLVTPFAVASVEASAERALLPVGGMSLSAEVCRLHPADPPVVSVWGVDPGGVEVGDTELTAEGVDALLGSLDQFAAQLRQFREQLLSETAGDGR